MRNCENGTKELQKVQQNDKNPPAREGGGALFRRAAERLGGRDGASIALALMLFLTCTVIGIVLITAGSTVTGSFAGREELDRRYYCVTSVVNLLRDRYDEKSVRFTLYEWEEYIYDSDGNLSDVIVHRELGDSARSVPFCTVGDKPCYSVSDVLSAAGNFLALQSLRVLGNMNDAEWRQFIPSGGVTAVANAVDGLPAEYMVTASARNAEGGEDRLPGLDAKITLSLANARGIQFVVSNTNGNDEGADEYSRNFYDEIYSRALYKNDKYYTYSLTMNFTADLLKETRLAASGRYILFTVNWKLQGVTE